MSIIKVAVDDQALYLTESPVVAAQGVNENYFQFALSSDWAGFGVVALFWKEGNETDVYESAVDGTGKALVPHEVTDTQGRICVGLAGTKGNIIHTSEVLKYRVVKGKYTVGQSSEPPTPGIYEQMLSLAGQMSDQFRQVVEEQSEVIEDLQADQAALRSELTAQQTTFQNTISGQMNTFIAGQAGDYGVTVLWDMTEDGDGNGILGKDTTVTLRYRAADYDYLDIYSFNKDLDSITTIPVDENLDQNGYAVRSLNVGSGNVAKFRAVEYRLQIVGTTLTIAESYAYWYDTSNHAEAITQANKSQYVGVFGISKIVGRKMVQNAELVDIRVGENGTTYQTAGAAVRGQFAEVKSQIPAIDASLATAGKAADAKATGDKFIDINGRLGEVTSALVKTDPSSNYLNPAEILANVQINASGAEEEYSGRNSSGWIPASDGDTVYFTGLNADGSLISTSGVSMLRLAWYDSGKNFIGANTWINAYTLPTAGIAYIRFTYTNSSTFQTARLLALMFSAPASAADIEAYRSEGYEVVDSVARKNTKIIVPDKFVDAWGDSRIANGGNTTGINKYLADKLGWYTANHGFGGQGSGEIAVSMGAMECYVSIDGNSIKSGDNVVTSIKVDHGAAMQNFMQNSSTYTAGVKCTIGGVDGYLWNYGGTVKFTPSGTLSSNVAVMPMTKVIPDPYIAMLHRFIVIWAGKNDFSNYTASGLYEYLADVVSAMAEHIPHTRFVILGETTTAADEYKTHGTARAVMDNYNKLMARRFPKNFIDIQAELMENGLEMAGITPTAEDTEYMAEGLLPPSLMSDETHQNPTCRRVIADIIYNHMVNMGWT